jgi:hypothetical protein
MLPRIRQGRLKPNWWTISPLVTSLLLWGAILYAGLSTASAPDNKDEQVAAVSASAEASAGRH